MDFKKIFGNRKAISIGLAVILIAAVGVVNYKLTNGATSARSKKSEEAAETEETEETEEAEETEETE